MPAARFLAFALSILCAFATALNPAQAETLARAGEGWLERVDGCLVLHLKGSPQAMGLQHGVLLKDHIQANVHYLLDVKGGQGVKMGPVPVYPVAAIQSIAKYQARHIPQAYNDELAGVAAGSGEPVERIRAANFIPELFHCSGFAVMNSATSDGTLYHGRVLDYAVDWQLQDHAVLIVAEPEDGIPFVNVSYAGFIGSVTGMNAQHVSIGEMGGGGLGHWDGVPMAVLVRQVLERANNLDEALATFRDQPRTCEYYYVIADGKTNEAVGVAATWQKFSVVRPGEAHPQLPTPVPDAVLLSVGKRYEELVQRAQSGHGKFTADSARSLMDVPVAMRSNLHNVLFAPRTTDFWVAHASHDAQPAATQTYHAFQLAALLARHPDASAPTLELPPAAAR
jgi:isopenicillin-N N-acyltransferase like protein